MEGQKRRSLPWEGHGKTCTFPPRSGVKKRSDRSLRSLALLLGGTREEYSDLVPPTSKRTGKASERSERSLLFFTPDLGERYSSFQVHPRGEIQLFSRLSPRGRIGRFQIPPTGEERRSSFSLPGGRQSFRLLSPGGEIVVFKVSPGERKSFIILSHGQRQRRILLPPTGGQ